MKFPESNSQNPKSQQANSLVSDIFKFRTFRANQMPTAVLLYGCALCWTEATTLISASGESADSQAEPTSAPW